LREHTEQGIGNWCVLHEPEKGFNELQVTPGLGIIIIRNIYLKVVIKMSIFSIGLVRVFLKSSYVVAIKTK
jgi:hypothetical protein